MTSRENGPQTKLQLDQMITNLRSMNINAPLVWLWIWDQIVDIYEQHSQDNSMLSNEYALGRSIDEEVTLDSIFETLWSNPPADFTLEYGTDQLDEAIMDWMIDNNFLVLLDDDDWLNEDDDDIVDLSADEETAMIEGLVKEELTTLVEL